MSSTKDHGELYQFLSKCPQWTTCGNNSFWTVGLDMFGIFHDEKLDHLDFCSQFLSLLFMAYEKGSTNSFPANGDVFFYLWCHWLWCSFETKHKIHFGLWCLKKASILARPQSLFQTNSNEKNYGILIKCVWKHFYLISIIKNLILEVKCQ